MRKYFLALFALFYVSLLQVEAKHVEQNEALKKAKIFFTQRNTSSLKSSTMESVADSFVLVNMNSSVGKVRLKSESVSVPAFYIFNRVNKGGFVIVAAEEGVKSILGYSDEGSISTENMPENISSWLDFYTNEIQYAINLDSTSSASMTRASAQASSVVVSPLLKNIKWNQSSPYNDLCPSISGTKTLTGCVATAMAQIMKYYNWPVKGTGSHQYYSTTVGDTLRANFGATTYDWTNMLSSYSSYTALQDTAVATLMYHCGVAVDMSYNTSANGGSGASVYDAGTAFFTYFGYDTDIQSVWKNTYSYADWKVLMKNEIDNSRPVLYFGASTDGAHAFVCDGYDSDDLFHINWGWSGTSNGYFELSALNPNVQGAGGSTGGYNSQQIALIGIQKPDGVSSSTNEIGIYNTTLTPSATTVSTTATFSISYGFLNYGLNTFSGYIGLALYQNGTLIKSLNTSSLPSLPGYYGLNSYSFPSSSLSGVAAGTYQIYAVYKPTGASSWSYMKKTTALNNCINVTISGSTATFSSDYLPVLKLTKILAPATNVYNNKTATFDVSVTNNGTAEFNSNVAVYIYNSGKTSTQYLGAGVVDVPVGETKTVQLSGTVSLPAGAYSAALVYDSGNNGGTTYVSAGPSSYSPVSLTVNATPAEAILSATNVVLAKKSVAQYDVDSITATVTNSGGYFDSYIIAFIFNSTGGSSIGYFGPTTYYIDNGKSMSVNLGDNLSLSSGSYLMKMYYYKNSTWNALSDVISFTVVNPTLSVSSNALNISAAANSSQNVSVTSNTTWTASVDDSWLTLSPASGFYGSTTLTMTAEENTTGSMRSANVSVEDNGSSVQTIVVTQAADASGIEETVSGKILLNPNPTTSYFLVIGLNEEQNVLVTDVSGKLILNKQLAPDESISVAGWSKGIYLVKVNSQVLKLLVK